LLEVIGFELALFGFKLALIGFKLALFFDATETANFSYSFYIKELT